MITLRDSAMLALTKLRTRKVRLTVTIVVSGLLFSALAGASLVARGVMGGINDFSKEGLGDRYIVQAFPQSSFGFTDKPELIDRATAINKDIIARKKAEAKHLGLAYDAENEPSPVIEFPGSDHRSLDPSHPAAKQALDEYIATNPLPGEDLFIQAAKKYGYKETYFSQYMSYDLSGAQFQVLKDGKEAFEANDHKGQFGGAGPSTGIDSFTSSWTIMSSALLEPFILPGQNLQAGTDGSIPVIVPQSAAEQLIGLKSLAASAKPADRLARTKEVREKAPDVRFAACYRNAESVQLLQLAIATKEDMEQNKNKVGYQKPSLIYSLPTEPCGSVPVTRDVRTSAEKTQADKQRQFDEIFGARPAAESTLTFRIVGIVPDPDYSGAVGVSQILRSLVTSTLGTGWYTPTEQMADNPLLPNLFMADIYSAKTYYAEFPTASAAKDFIDKENCEIDYGKISPETDPLDLCAEQGKAFAISAYGSNSLALDDAKRAFGKFFKIAALVVSGIACIIMMGTVGRMIADSRRETAVFRAIGAKKLDVAQIYVTYVILLSLLISLFALLAGLVLALFAHSRWSADVTIQAITAYNAQNLDKTFPLYALYLPDILMLIGLALAAGLLSAVFPLFRNLRRNPIRDMRDDT